MSSTQVRPQGRKRNTWGVTVVVLLPVLILIGLAATAAASMKP
jgi:hypothetical protein